MLDLSKGQIHRRAVRCVLFVAALGTLGACSNVRPFNYTAIHEIPSGPGLVSGDDGVFVLYGDGRTGNAD